MEQRTSIDDLELSGHELSEEHLRLASGGRAPGICLKITYSRKWDLELDI
jgi:hypothetical protein